MDVNKYFGLIMVRRYWQN